jgi:hypothetical protein
MTTKSTHHSEAHQPSDSTQRTGGVTVTGTVALPETLARPIDGTLMLNNVRVGIYAEAADAAITAVNRHTSLTAVTASLSPERYLVLASGDPVLKIDGDQSVLEGAGVPGGVYRSS